MEHTDAREAASPVTSSSLSDAPSAPTARSSGTLAAAQLPVGTCPTCGATPTANGATAAVPNYVYAIGSIESRFPRLSVEKEFAQVHALGATGTHGLTDKQALRSLLDRPENRYLAKQLCWVMTIEGLETYLLVTRDSSDLNLLIETVRPNPRATDVDIVIGRKGPLAPSGMCNGLMVPIVACDQVYSFDVDSLIKSLPNPNQIPQDQFTATAEELLGRIMQMADNAGRPTSIERSTISPSAILRFTPRQRKSTPLTRPWRRSTFFSRRSVGFVRLSMSSSLSPIALLELRRSSSCELT
jgi:hypothetical protein